MVLELYGVDDPDGSTIAVAAIVEEFATVDPRSFSFRYPVDTGGRPIELVHNRLDLVGLADVMKGVDGYCTRVQFFWTNLTNV